MTLFDSWINFVQKSVFEKHNHEYSHIDEYLVKYSFHLYLDDKDVLEFTCIGEERFKLFKKSIFDLMGVRSFRLDSIHIWETGETKYNNKTLKFYYKEDFIKRSDSIFKEFYFYPIDKSLGFGEDDILNYCKFLTDVKNGIYT